MWASMAADPEYPRLKQWILGRTGLAYFLDKDEALIQRLQRRFAACGVVDCRSYLHLLEAEAGRGAEMDALAEELTIGETFFFRYAQQFQALRDRVLPDVIARNAAHRRLRIWSAGCSNGAEAYSVAALVLLVLGDRRPDWQVSIIGTDINRTFLAQARAGLFGDWAMRDVSPGDRAAAVERVGGAWQVRPELRRMVEFRQHNLMDLRAQPLPDDPLADFDIVLCRNVMIYFDRSILEALVPKLAARLVDNGWLLVGHAESGDLFSTAFETVPVPGATLYRRRSGGARRATDWPVPKMAVPPRRFEPSGEPRQSAPPRRQPPPKALSPAAPIVEADGDWATAEARYRAEVASMPTSPLAHYFLALVLDHGERPAEVEAEHALRRALYLDRGFAMAHFHLGALLRRRGDLAGALKAFSNALRSLSGLEENMSVPAAELSAAELRNVLLGQIRSVSVG